MKIPLMGRTQAARVACISQSRISAGSVAVTRWPPVAVKLKLCLLSSQLRRS
jgi:hypothetical protein